MDIDELRARVERKRKAKEFNELRDELLGRDRPIDPDAVYLSVKEIAADAGCDRVVVARAIATGELPGIKGRGNTQRGIGHAWAVHPDDAFPWIEKYRALRSIGVKS